MQTRNQNRIAAINSPHELALGIAFGVVIGIMPKDSAMPWLIALFFLLSRGNLLCGIISAVVMSLVSPSFDGITDKLGMSLLSVESLQSTFAAWMELPWIAWTRFNNTVVAGSFALGILSCLPVYLLSQVFFRMWGIEMIQRVMDTRLIRILFGDTEDEEAKAESSEPALSTEI